MPILAADASDAAKPLTLEQPPGQECVSPVVRRCPPPTPAAPTAPVKSDPQATRQALERERRAQAVQELSPIIIYGEREQKRIQEVFDANLKPGRRALEASTRSFQTPDGRRCTQVEGVGYSECTPNANAPPPTGFSSAFTAGKP
ncbi:MAG: hypothetical protein ACK5TK_04950 [Betaproteobacteria bacterium]